MSLEDALLRIESISQMSSQDGSKAINIYAVFKTIIYRYKF
jgi:hypothetical protein